MKTDKFILVLEKDGKVSNLEIESTNLEDATIYGSNYADDNDCELLAVDYSYEN